MSTIRLPFAEVSLSVESRIPRVKLPQADQYIESSFTRTGIVSLSPVEVYYFKFTFLNGIMFDTIVVSSLDGELYVNVAPLLSLYSSTSAVKFISGREEYMRRWSRVVPSVILRGSTRDKKFPYQYPSAYLTKNVTKPVFTETFMRARTLITFMRSYVGRPIVNTKSPLAKISEDTVWSLIEYLSSLSFSKVVSGKTYKTLPISRWFLHDLHKLLPSEKVIEDKKYHFVGEHPMGAYLTPPGMLGYVRKKGTLEEIVLLSESSSFILNSIKSPEYSCFSKYLYMEDSYIVVGKPLLLYLSMFCRQEDYSAIMKSNTKPIASIREGAITLLSHSQAITDWLRYIKETPIKDMVADTLSTSTFLKRVIKGKSDNITSMLISYVMDHLDFLCPSLQDVSLDTIYLPYILLQVPETALSLPEEILTSIRELRMNMLSEMESFNGIARL